MLVKIFVILSIAVNLKNKQLKCKRFLKVILRLMLNVNCCMPNFTANIINTKRKSAIVAENNHSAVQLLQFHKNKNSRGIQNYGFNSDMH